MPLALWPAVGAVAAWNAGENGALALAAAGVILAALPALFTFLGFSGSRKVAEAFALAGMVIGILFVLRNGVTLAAIPAVGYFVVYAYLSHDRLRSGDEAKSRPAPPPPAEHPLAWLKENVEAIAVAFIMALVIRCFCVEVFKIPSSSMEPTLLGDTRERSGDRIMVTKLTYGLQSVARFEPVVFKFPLNPMKNFIKRVVGLPGEKFMLHRGNVYTIPDGSKDGRFRICRKPLKSQRSIWIPAWTRDERPLLQSVDSFQAAFHPARGTTSTVRDGVLTGGGATPSSWTAEPINEAHVGDSSTTVNDILFEADLKLAAGAGSFWVRIDHDLGPFELQLKPSGGSTLSVNKAPHALKTPAFPAGKTVHLEFMVFDGQAIVLFDGRIQAEIVFQETYDDIRLASEKQGLRFGGDAAFALSDLRVGQDIHYKPKTDGYSSRLSPDSPLVIPPGHYFMLGDNVNNSHDGRAWRKYSVKMKSGELIEYESQALKDDRARSAWAKRTGRKEPDVLLEADRNGHERALYDEDIEKHDKGGETFPFVEGSYIIGRAFAVCWPLSRSLRLIR